MPQVNRIRLNIFFLYSTSILAFPIVMGYLIQLLGTSFTETNTAVLLWTPAIVLGLMIACTTKISGARPEFILFLAPTFVALFSGLFTSQTSRYPILFLLLTMPFFFYYSVQDSIEQIKSIALVKEIKVLGFNNFQVLKTTITNQSYDKVALEVNNRFYIKDLKNCDDYYSKFTVQNALEKNSDKIVKFSKLPKYTSKNLQYILDNKLFIDSKLFPIYENI